MVILLVELVNVVEELDVLLFSFDECSDNLVDVVDSRGLHDRLKGLLDNLRVPHILVQQALLLDILVNR